MVSVVLQDQPVELKENLSYKEELIAILARNHKVLSKVIPLAKVLWRNHSHKEAT